MSVMTDNVTQQAERDFRAIEKGKLNTLSNGQVFTRETLQSAGILIYLQNVKATSVCQVSSLFFRLAVG